MRKSFLLFVFAALFLVGCSKESSSLCSGDAYNVAVMASLPEMATKALIDGDGQADSIDHWVIEVRDTLQRNVVYYWAEKAGEKGVRTQTFELTLVKGHTYEIAFWADKSGCYNAGNLKQVSFKDISKVGNSDSYDAFFACEQFKADGRTSMSAKLYRPLAQVNIITTDLPKLNASSTKEAYLSYKPKTFSFKTTLPTEFDVYSGKTSGEKEVTITPAAAVDTCYADYAAAAAKTTIFMVYALTTLDTKTDGKSDVRNIDFSFMSGNVEIPCKFGSIPLKRNWRTNIIGEFMTYTTTWTVEVVPNWIGEKNVTEADK